MLCIRRQRVSKAAAVVLIAFLLRSASSAAQIFPPDNGWEPVTIGGNVLHDMAGDVSVGANARDIVGDVNPAAFVSADDAYVYFRLRVAANPLNAGVWVSFGWGVEIDTNDSKGNYEELVLLNGKTQQIEAWSNAIQQ